MFVARNSKIVDMEKYARQIVMRKISPMQICHFHKSLQMVLYILNLFHEHPFIHDYLFAENIPIQGECTNLIKTLEHQLNMKIIEESGQGNVFENRIIQPGISDTLDQLIATQKRDCI